MDIKERLRQISKERRDLNSLSKIMSLESTRRAINLMYIEYWSKIDNFPTENELEIKTGISSVSGKFVTLKHHYVANTTYDKLAHKANGFGHGNTVRYDVLVERVISGFTFSISDFVDAIIPEEEMKLLTILGKTKTEVSQPYVSTSIFCEFNSPSPDIPF